MPKTKFTATDPAGVIHTRTTERTYEYTVVTLPCYEGDVAFYASESWDKSEAKNFRYYRQIAAGNDPYPARQWRDDPARFTAEEIAESLAHAEAENAKRLADAIEKVAGHADAASYCAGQRAKRLAAVEQRKAEGYYQIWQNAGWCGRLDLASKLAQKCSGSRTAAVQILPADAN